MFFNYSFIFISDCELLKERNHATKHVIKSVEINENKTLEYVVRYACNEGYRTEPRNTNTTFTCKNGEWIYNEFNCVEDLKSW